MFFRVELHDLSFREELWPVVCKILVKHVIDFGNLK